MGHLAATIDGVYDVVYQVSAIAEEPLEVRPEAGEVLDPRLLQPLDGKQRNQAHQGSHAKLVEAPVGPTEYVVEEPVLVVPK